MTIAAHENPPICFPETLFSAPNQDESDKVWWIARTKSRQEKALAWDLAARKTEYFLPLVSKPQKSRGRMRASIVPLFNGYMFFKGSLLDRQNALQTGRVAQVLEVDDQQGLLSELSQIALAASEKISLELCDFVKRGQRVRIIAGPFKGLEGVVNKQKNRTRLLLTVAAIKQAAAIEISLDQAQPI